MDDIACRARPAAGHRRQPEFGQVRAGASLPDWKLHAGGVAGGRPVQEGDPDRQSELFAADTGRRWRARNAGECRCVCVTAGTGEPYCLLFSDNN